MNCLLLLILAFGAFCAFTLPNGLQSDSADWRVVDGICMTHGERLPDTDNSSFYYICILLNGTFVAAPVECENSSYFYDPVTQMCDIIDLTTTPTETSTTEELSTSTTEISTVSETETTTDVSRTTPGGETTTSTASDGDTTTTEISTITMDTESTTTVVPTTTEGADCTTPTTAASGVLPPCTVKGRQPHPTSCTRYIFCFSFAGAWYPFVYRCPRGTRFHATARVCVVGTCTDPTPTSTTSGCSPPSTTGVSTTPSYQCTENGSRLADPNNCRGYYRCFLFNGQWIYYVYQCPPRTYWNKANAVCKVGNC